jgi:hypothetical protein
MDSEVVPEAVTECSNDISDFLKIRRGNNGNKTWITGKSHILQEMCHIESEAKHISGIPKEKLKNRDHRL